MNNLHGCVAALILLIVVNDNDVKRMKTNYQMLILMSKLRQLTKPSSGLSLSISCCTQPLKLCMNN